VKNGSFHSSVHRRKETISSSELYREKGEGSPSLPSLYEKEYYLCRRGKDEIKENTDLNAKRGEGRWGSIIFTPGKGILEGKES